MIHPARPSLLRNFLDAPSEDTFLPVYRETHKVVYSICFRIMRNQEDALDAFQGAYARLIACARAGSDLPNGKSGDETAIMKRFAALEANRLRMKRTRRMTREQTMAEVPETGCRDSNGMDAVAGRETNEILQSALNELPDNYRIPVILHYLHGMTHEEISKALRVPRNTVSSRLRRSLAKLRPKLKRAGLTDFTATVGIVGLAMLPSDVSAKTTWKASSSLAIGMAGGVEMVTIASILKTCAIVCVVLALAVATGLGLSRASRDNASSQSSGYPGKSSGSPSYTSEEDQPHRTSEVLEIE